MDIKHFIGMEDKIYVSPDVFERLSTEMELKPLGDCIVYGDFEIWRRDHLKSGSIMTLSDKVRDEISEYKNLKLENDMKVFNSMFVSSTLWGETNE